MTADTQPEARRDAPPPRLLFFCSADDIALRRWVDSFADRGWPVAVAAPSRAAFGPWPGVEVHEYAPRLGATAGRVSWRLQRALLGRSLRRIARRFRADVHHVHWLDRVAAEVADAALRPLVLTPWGSDVLRLKDKPPAHAELVGRALAQADLVTCNSAALRDACRALGAEPARLVEVQWGVDTDRFAPAAADPALRAELGLDGKRVILSNRRTAEVYNLPVIVRAFGQVAGRFEDAALLMLVDDVVRAEGWRALAGEAADRVVVRPWVPHDRLADYYALAELYVSVPSSDSTSVSLLEAMACGAVPIVSDLPAPREWVADGENGLVVPPGDADALAAALARALSEPHLAAARKDANRRIVIERASSRVHMDRMAAHYRRLAGRGAADGPAPPREGTP